MSDPLLEPFQLKQLAIRNRVISTAHEPSYSEEGMPKERYVAYHVEKAKGGIGMTMTAGSMVIAPDSPGSFGNLDGSDDRVIPYLKKLTDAVKDEGAAIMIQITHLGRRTSNYAEDWLPTVWPSSVKEPAHRAYPKEIEHWDIKRIIKAYADTARRCKEGGMDGVEIEAYGHLLDGFWSPAWNFREDEYGGSLENRMRFGMEVLEAIRKEVGDDFIVGFRMVADEDFDGGLSFNDGVDIAQRFARSGMVDFLNLIKGHIETDAALTNVIPNMGMPSAPFLSFAKAVKDQVDLPIFHAARITDLATARYAIREGILDMVGMTRAHMADPYIVKKLMEGEAERVRPCVGASFCLDRIYEGAEAVCIHNAATGRELTVPQRIEKGNGGKKAVVVGAGPAGLEAARVLTSRGHQVHVFEAGDKVGGQVHLAARPERRRELISITEWLYSECQQLGVEFEFNTYAEGADVLSHKPDLVVVATGGIPNTHICAGAEHALSTWDILSGSVPIANDVLIYDDNGQHPAFTCAEFMAAEVDRMEFVTPERMLASQIGGTNFPAYMKVLQQNDVVLSMNLRLNAIEKDADKLKVLFTSDYSDVFVTRSVDQVIIENGTLALDEVYQELMPQSINKGEIDYAALLKGSAQNVVNNEKGEYLLYRVGDAVTSRNIHAAIYDSLRLLHTF